VSCLQSVGQNQKLLIANDFFENVANFIYFGSTVTCQNCIQEEIENRSNAMNACYRSAQNILSSHLVSKSLKIKM
jgi:hypothetical protein